jgi:hypothetical protein
VVRLIAPDRHQRVRTLRQRVRNQVLQLPRLVPAVREPRIAVLPLGPDPSPTKVRTQPIERMHRTRPERERIPRKVTQRHTFLPKLGRRPASS